MRASTASPIANQLVLHLEAVAPLHFVARVRAERFADEVAVGHFHDGVGVTILRVARDRRAEAVHEERHLRVVDAPHGVDAEPDLQVVAAEHRVVADEFSV